MLCDSDYHHFRQDMRKIHSKHTTNLNLVNQLQEDTSEKDETLRGLQDYMMLSIIRVPKQLFVRGELPLATTPWKVQSLLPSRGQKLFPFARESGPEALLHL
ncbi:hypothetical protein TNCV_2737801 [Trichonephila clavipes]|nr:hypothetical protein TNCV_2737801 [Trichonephila clavipes]